jgi:hypothetical protein
MRTIGRMTAALGAMMLLASGESSRTTISDDRLQPKRLSTIRSTSSRRDLV